MLCENCQKNQATTHMRKTVNGETSEWHLCAECAKEQGIGGVFSDFGMFPSLHSTFNTFNSLFTNLFGEPAITAGHEETCPGCGLTFDQIARTGKVGCAQCYTAFRDKLKPSIERIHGQTNHIGKQPVILSEEPETQVETTPDYSAEIAKLQAELDACLEKQEYERCAEIRDRIRSLEEKKEG